MKLKTLFAALSFLLIAVPVFAKPDLTGVWCVSMSEAYSSGTFIDEGNGYTYISYPSFEEKEYEIEIEVQDNSSPYGILFAGFVDVGGEEETYFSGVLDGETISMTHWDSVTRGIFKKKNNTPMQINFINNAFDADHRRGKTSIGVANKGACQ